MEKDRGGGMLCEVQMEGWFLNPVSKGCLQRIFRNSSRKRVVDHVPQHPLSSPAAQGWLFRSLPKQEVSTNLAKTHLNKTAAAPLANPDTTGCFAVSRITYCSVTWCLLPLHPFEVRFAVKRWLCVMQKKVPFPSVYLPNKD